jgi:ribonuclease P protein component
LSDPLPGGACVRLRFPRSARLTRVGEFAQLKQEGRSFPGRFVVLSVLTRPDDSSPARVGIITSRRMGNAVARNRVRRHLREIFRASRPQLRPGLWLVLIARAPAARAAHAELQAEWDRLARRSGICAPPPCAP